MVLNVPPIFVCDVGHTLRWLVDDFMQDWKSYAG